MEIKKTMSDLVDDCANECEAFVAEGISKQKNNNRLLPIGYCHYCNEKLSNSSMLFCDSACKEDYDITESIKNKQYSKR